MYTRITISKDDCGKTLKMFFDVDLYFTLLLRSKIIIQYNTKYCNWIVVMILTYRGIFEREHGVFEYFSMDLNLNGDDS